MDAARKTELAGLTEMERVALVALIGKIVAADRNAGEDERRKVAEVAEAIGVDAYDRALETAGRLFHDEDDLKAYLECIRRRDAREIIYGTVMDVSISEAVSPAEAAFLEWLAPLWGLEAHPVSDV
jgi:hypothetical protein